MNTNIRPYTGYQENQPQIPWADTIVENTGQQPYWDPSYSGARQGMVSGNQWAQGCRVLTELST
jgi:hypothetical protein